MRAGATPKGATRSGPRGQARLLRLGGVQGQVRSRVRGQARGQVRFGPRWLARHWARLRGLARRLLRLGGALLAAGLCLGLGALLVDGWRALERLPVERVLVQGQLEHVTQDALQERVRGAIDGGLLTVDLQRVRAAVEAMPWVHRAQVRRRWPDSLEVRVTEQVPIARWAERGYLNQEGELFVPSAGEASAPGAVSGTGGSGDASAPGAVSGAGGTGDASAPGAVSGTGGSGDASAPGAVSGTGGTGDASGSGAVSGTGAPGAGLPRLSGPPGTQGAVMARFKQVQDALAGLPLRLVGLHRDPRGSLTAELVGDTVAGDPVAGGAVLVLGRRDIEVRLLRFARLYRLRLAHNPRTLRRVDMRYSHGAAVAWGEAKPAAKLAVSGAAGGVRGATGGVGSAAGGVKGAAHDSATSGAGGARGATGGVENPPPREQQQS